MGLTNPCEHKGNQTLSLDSSSAATISLTGSALAVVSGDNCEEDAFYGTMTEEIFGQTWQDNVVALAIENGELELAQGEEETLVVRVVYGNGMASERKANSNFTFTTSAQGTASVGSNTGVVTAGSTTGDAYISVALTDRADIAPAIAKVTVNG